MTTNNGTSEQPGAEGPAPFDVRHAISFLSSVFAGQEQGVLVLFRKPDNVSSFLQFDRGAWPGEAAAEALVLRKQGNVYFAIGVQGGRPAKGRGTAGGVIAIPGFWSDIDALGPNHAATTLPPTIEDSWRILNALPFRPTLVVYTGGGIQVYWLFREPWQLDTEKERAKAKSLSRTLQRFLQDAAIKQGWRMDDTADLCRLLRLPGTYNRKQAQPFPVRYELVGAGQRFNPSDFEDFLEIEADPELKAHLKGPAPAEPSADFLRILAGCRWMRHCKDNARTLPEPEWYRMLSVLGRCKDGTRIAHEMSKPYPKYSERETTEKLKQATGAAGPATCSFIESELGRGDCCGECNRRSKIKSPIVLGIASRRGDRHPDQQTGPADYRKRLPRIQSNDRQLRDLTHESLEALRNFNQPPSIFVRGGKPVCIHEEENGRHVIIEGTDRVIRNRLTLAAAFYEITPNGEVRNCPPPMDCVKDLLADATPGLEVPASPGCDRSPRVAGRRQHHHRTRIRRE